MLKAIKKLSIAHVDYFGHALNIGVSVILNLDNVIVFKKKKISSYSKTRWWSMLELINLIIDQDLGLASFLRSYKNGNYTNLFFQESDVIILKNLKYILQPIREITDNMAGDSYVTLVTGSAILPIVFSIKLKLSEVTERIDTDLNRPLIENMYSAIIDVLNRRYTNNLTLMICSNLDPRFKVEFIVHENLLELKTKIIEQCETNFKKCTSDETSDRSCISQPTVQKKRKTIYQQFFVLQKLKMFIIFK